MTMKKLLQFLLFAAAAQTIIFSSAGWAAPPENAGKPENLPAAAKSQQDLDLEKLPPPIEDEKARKPDPKGLEESCRKNPGCAKQMAELKNAKPLPAAEGEAPEDLELQKLPEPAQRQANQ